VRKREPIGCASRDVEDRLACELTIDETTGDRADLAPWRFDGDLRPQLSRRDQIGEEREADPGGSTLVSSREKVRP
jgi:hypothetical protein